MSEENLPVQSIGTMHTNHPPIPPAVQLDRHDMQGLLASGYSSLPVARFLLLQITQAERAKAWLKTIIPAITVVGRRSDTVALNVAFTYSGMEQLQAPSLTLHTFSQEYQEGMTASHRARLLGDCDTNDPRHWQWGGPETKRVDVLLMLYARSASDIINELDRYQNTLDGLVVVHQLDMPQVPNVRKEHFGFHDGISQPTVNGLTRSSSAESDRNRPIAAGEFVLGYENQYGEKLNSPLWPRDLAEPVDFGRNGTYIVLRQLSQDVYGFWRSVRQNAMKQYGKGDVATCLHVAARWVGRWPGGAPVTLSPMDDDPRLADTNDFVFMPNDPIGERCPMGAHIRRANPRDSLGTSPDESIKLVNKHRLLRRGRVYGPPVISSMEPADILNQLDGQPDDTQDRGLNFVALNASISRQFEFVQHTWLQNTKFAGLYNDADPITGQAPFTTPGLPFALRTSPLPLFITVRGGAYFFMPGLEALRLLATQ